MEEIRNHILSYWIVQAGTGIYMSLKDFHVPLRYLR